VFGDRRLHRLPGDPGGGLPAGPGRDRVPGVVVEHVDDPRLRRVGEGDAGGVDLPQVVRDGAFEPPPGQPPPRRLLTDQAVAAQDRVHRGDRGRVDAAPAQQLGPDLAGTPAGPIAHRMDGEDSSCSPRGQWTGAAGSRRGHPPSVVRLHTRSGVRRGTDLPRGSQPRPRRCIVPRRPPPGSRTHAYRSRRRRPPRARPRSSARLPWWSRPGSSRAAGHGDHDPELPAPPARRCEAGRHARGRWSPLGCRYRDPGSSRRCGGCAAGAAAGRSTGGSGRRSTAGRGAGPPGHEALDRPRGGKLLHRPHRDVGILPSEHRTDGCA
jgi:hypothetical protein